MNLGPEKSLKKGRLALFWGRKPDHCHLEQNYKYMKNIGKGWRNNRID